MGRETSIQIFMKGGSPPACEELAQRARRLSAAPFGKIGYDIVA
jgi:hypothetical protein